ncbi:efflux RND transporter permease subunit [Caenispirillum bisanense]|uniref:Multidrug efflux pump subunit AcrB n=1 Tax=Caenispirillum bisanense TaxID=414052 RepID=A0A286GY32_9PROT|nr:efflux RND transporter permease subunit [Caenispirillum bisanense]SOE00096.1 Multidrug efflux pump subunit AcrB [Caenispirillum bisanense]
MIRWFAAHPVAANLLMLAFFVVGLFTLPSLKRETFPDIDPDEVQIQAVYRGASAEDVEDAVCQRVEDAVEGVEGLDETRCEAREGVAVAVAKMIEGTDLDRFTDDVRTAVDAIDGFPPDVERPTIKQLGRIDFVASVALTGPMGASDLRSYAEAVKARALRVPELSQVTIRGFSDRQYRIEVSADALRRHGLSITDVADVVGRQSLNLPGGVVETGAADVLVRFDDERVTPQRLGDLVIVGGAAGGQVRLADIATITDAFEAAENQVIFEGRRAALLEIAKTRDQDSLEVMAALNRFLDAERARAPAGVDLTVTLDAASIVEDRLTMLLENGAMGLALVFLSLWLFFSFRYSFWVSMGLPVSFFGTFALMTLFGLSIDMITMVGLLIATGLLMDDAIVIAENVAAHLARGKKPFAAAVEGTRQVLPGVVSSFLTTVCVFGALAFMEGRIGQVMKVMPIVLVMTLAVSLIEAFLILPHHLAHSLGHMAAKTPSRFRVWFEAAFEDFRQNRLGALVDRAVTWRYLTIGIMIALLVGTGALIAGGAVKFRAFPAIEGDLVQARILLPQGTPLARTEQVVEQIIAAGRRMEADFAPRQPEGQSLIRQVTVQYNTNTDAYETGPHVATVTLDLLSSQVRDAPMAEVINRWREQVGSLPDVIGLKFAERQLGPGGRAIDIRLKGEDLDELKAAALDLRHWLGGYAGVLDLSDDLRPGKPEMRLTLQEGAVPLGVTGRTIAAQLRGAFQGTQVTEVQQGGETWEIQVMLAEADRDSLADLDTFAVMLPDGTQVPLASVADVVVDRGYARIHRVDGRRTVTVQGEVDSAVANAAEIVADTRARFLPTLAERYPDVTVDFEGQAKEGSTTGKSVLRNFVVGLIGIYMLLALQFRSYLEPVVVMAAIPLALVGAVFGHLIQGLEMSMPSMVGMAALAGVVVNDTILIVMFIKEHRAAGLPTAEAARMAARARFRAILLTSLTTVAGLLPLLLEKSLQAQVLIPLATSLAFGLASATVLALFLVPALYTILDDFRLDPAAVEPDPETAVLHGESAPAEAGGRAAE